ncbi:MAG: helix-turn-helix domain-containing protein [Acidimicrobiia bacterium]|nr:helix-turn-helix domain-containing protein [Acidimicrobiia bacterium]
MTAGPTVIHDDTALPSVPTVTAVSRAVRILEAVAAADTPLTAGRIARELSLPRSTTLGLCVTLAETGLLQRDPAGLYHLGRGLMNLSHQYLRKLDVIEEFQNACRELGVLTTETMLVAVRDGRYITSVAKRPGSSVFGLEISVGRPVPAHATAMGKAMLASLTDDELASLYEDRPFEKLTENTIDNFRTLLDELALVRTDGYAVDDEETTPGLMCVGAPVLMSRPMSEPTAVAAVAVALVKSANNDETVASAAEGVRAVADVVSERLP